MQVISLYMTFAGFLSLVAPFDEATALSFARITVSKKVVVCFCSPPLVLT
jgi:hypothetical protein